MSYGGNEILRIFELIKKKIVRGPLRKIGHELPPTPSIPIQHSIIDGRSPK
jgi:hypothetical protein